jgi:hypothetical protein
VQPGMHVSGGSSVIARRAANQPRHDLAGQPAIGTAHQPTPSRRPEDSRSGDPRPADSRSNDPRPGETHGA